MTGNNIKEKDTSDGTQICNNLFLREFDQTVFSFIVVQPLL